MRKTKFIKFATGLPSQKDLIEVEGIGLATFTRSNEDGTVNVYLGKKIMTLQGNNSWRYLKY